MQRARETQLGLRLSAQEAKLRLLELGEAGEAEEHALRSRLSVWGITAAVLAGTTALFAGSGGRGSDSSRDGHDEGERRGGVRGFLRKGARAAARIGAVAAPIVLRRMMGK